MHLTREVETEAESVTFRFILNIFENNCLLDPTSSVTANTFFAYCLSLKSRKSVDNFLNYRAMKLQGRKLWTDRYRLQIRQDGKYKRNGARLQIVLATIVTVCQSWTNIRVFQKIMDN